MAASSRARGALATIPHGEHGVTQDPTLRTIGPLAAPAALRDMVGRPDGAMCARFPGGWAQLPMAAVPPDDRATQDPLVAVYFEKRANLVRFLAARSGSLAQAEDLAQDLYLKIASRGVAIDAQSPVALLYRMAANLVLDAARSARRSATRETAWRSESGEDLGGDEVVQEPGAEATVISRQRLAQLVEAVAELPPQMQRAFRLHKLEGRSQAETAQAMGVSVKAVEKHISAALKALTRRVNG